MNNKAIGVFDSGLGGLTAVKEIKKLLPNESIIYFGDTGRVPYGTRSNQTICRYAKEDIEFLLRHDVKLIVAACGTVSSVVPDAGNLLNIPYTGVVAPAVNAATSVTKNKKVGVIGTAATVKSHSFKQALQKINGDIDVYECACPLFVPVAENGFADDFEISLPIAKRYLTQFINKEIDTLILGCTHFPLLKKVISEVLKNVTLVDTGEQAAIETKRILTQNNILSDNKSENRYFVSDTVQGFAQISSLFLGEDIKDKITQVKDW